LEVFTGFANWPAEVGLVQPAEVMYVQNRSHMGLQANVNRYRSSPIMHPVVPDEYRPALFQNGCRASFPHPLAEIYPPSQVKTDVWQRWIVNFKTPPPGLTLLAPGLDVDGLHAGLPTTVSAPASVPKLPPAELEHQLLFGGLDTLDADYDCMANPCSVKLPSASVIAGWAPPTPKIAATDKEAYLFASSLMHQIREKQAKQQASASKIAETVDTMSGLVSVM
jgi:hypothetical protein